MDPKICPTFSLTHLLSPVTSCMAWEQVLLHNPDNPMALDENDVLCGTNDANMRKLLAMIGAVRQPITIGFTRHPW